VDAIFDGEVLRPQEPLTLTPNHHYSITIDEPTPEAPDTEDAWSVLRSLAGSYDGPADWSTEHDHYIYGAEKRSNA